MAACSIACISVPLPSGGPKLEKITLPIAGDEATAVRQTFGEPQRLDTPSNWVYEWTTERKFVIVPVMPTGMPAGAAVAGNRYRMLVEVGTDGRVVRVACTAREAPEDGVPPLDCESPTGPLRSRASTLFAYRLDSKPGFEKVDFFQPELTGAATPMVLSPDGRLLAATDRKNRLWVVDTESGEVVHHHEGQPVKFFSMAPPGPVNAVFSRDGERLAVAQRKVGAEFLTRTPDGAFETLLELGDDDLRQVAVRGDDDTIIAFGELGLITLRPDGSRSTAFEPAARLDFHANGPERIESGAGTGDLIAVRFGQTWWTGGRTAVFTADGRGVAILDLRNDYARIAKQGYRFSQDGSGGSPTTPAATSRSGRAPGSLASPRAGFHLTQSLRRGWPSCRSPTARMKRKRATCRSRSETTGRWWRRRARLQSTCGAWMAVNRSHWSAL